MVILISAESCTGKTIMAQKLLEKYKIPYLSIDHLKMGLYRADNNCGFTPENSNDIIEDKIWPIIKGIIMTVIENNQHIIIEGCYLFPGRLKEFSEDYLRFIIPVFMGFTKKYVERNYFSGIIAHRSDIELRKYNEERSMEQIITENEKLKEMCQAEAINYFEIDEDYESDTAKIYQWIDNEVNHIMED